MAAVDFEKDIASVTKKIVESPDNPDLYMERGKIFHRAGIKDKALNDFLKVVELDPSNKEAAEYVRMLREIFAFRYMDYYNP